MQNLNYYLIKIKKGLFFLLGLFLLTFIVITSIIKIETGENIWIEVEDADIIKAPLQIFEDNGASGKKAMVSKSPSHIRESFASYVFNAPTDGQYILWARAFWIGGCSNSYTARMDVNLDANSLIVGNDNLFNVWHWVKGPSFVLKRGKHTLYIWNEEFDARLDKILLTSNASYKPVGQGEVLKEYFFDFEDGKIPKYLSGDTLYWQLIKKNNNTAYCIKNKRNSSIPRYSYLDCKNDSTYYFSFDLKKLAGKQNNDVSLIFNYINNEHYYKIRIKENTIQLSLVQSDLENILKKVLMNNAIDTVFKTYSLIYHYPEIIFKINGKTKIKTISCNITGGKIGFGSINDNITFDNIEYKPDIMPGFDEIFFWQSIDRLKNGINTSLAWNFVGGDWILKHNTSIMPLQCKGKALVLTGKEYWKNYIFSVAVNTKEEAGICFFVQDSINYYLNRIVYRENSSFLQLIKVIDNVEQVLCEKKLTLLNGEWYKMTVKVFNDSIIARLDDKDILEYSDTTYQEGAIGLWSHSSSTYTSFNNLLVAPASKNEQMGSNVYEYTFEMRERAGMDFCDWENSGNIFSQKQPGPIIAITKKLFEEVFMENKRIFSGNFQLNVIHKDLPMDIDGNIFVKLENIDKKIDYSLVLKEAEVVFLKNDKILLKKKIRIDRRNYSLSFNNMNWILSSDNHTIFEFKDDFFNGQSFHLGVGYSGIGMGDIVIQRVELKADKCIQ